MDASTARTLNIRKIVATAGGPTDFANSYGAGRWSQAQVSQWISDDHPKSIGRKLARAIEDAVGLPLGMMDRWDDAPIDSMPTTTSQPSFFDQAPRNYYVAPPSVRDAVDKLLDRSPRNAKHRDALARMIHAYYEAQEK